MFAKAALFATALIGTAEAGKLFKTSKYAKVTLTPLDEASEFSGKLLMRQKEKRGKAYKIKIYGKMWMQELEEDETVAEATHGMYIYEYDDTAVSCDMGAAFNPYEGTSKDGTYTGLSAAVFNEEAYKNYRYRDYATDLFGSPNVIGKVVAIYDSADDTGNVVACGRVTEASRKSYKKSRKSNKNKKSKGKGKNK